MTEHFYLKGPEKRGNPAGMNLSSFLQWRIHTYLYGHLGWRMAQLYINLLGSLYFLFKRAERHQIQEAVRSVFASLKSAPEIRSINRQVFRGIRAHYYEKLFNAFSSAGTLRNFLQRHMASQGISAIEEGLSRGKGVLLITAHFGAVEFIPGFLAAKGYPVTILVRFSSGQLREISLQKAKAFRAQIIDVDHTPNVLKAILDSLRANRIVVTQCDEIDEWRPSPYQIHSFLGKPVNLDRSINILLKRTQASIVFGIMRRESFSRYQFIVTPWEEMARTTEYTGALPAGRAVLKLLERYIYAHPEQWYQWRKYAQMGTSPVYGTLTCQLPSLPVWEPTLGKAS